MSSILPLSPPPPLVFRARAEPSPLPVRARAPEPRSLHAEHSSFSAGNVAYNPSYDGAYKVRA
jgi:hypothetical protein